MYEAIELKLFAIGESGNSRIYGIPESEVADIAGSRAILPKSGTSNLELSISPPLPLKISINKEKFPLPSILNL